MATRLKWQPVNQARPQLLRWVKSNRRLSRFWVLFIALLAALLLSGCVHADLEINFRGQSGGEIVQHIKLAQLTTVSSSAAQDWFDGIKRRARQLRGKANRSDQEIEVTIPFGSPADLEAKVNQLLNPADVKIPSRNIAPATATGETASAANPELQLPLVQSHLKVKQQNFLFFLRNRLIYDLDLRSLGVQSANGNLLFSPDSLLELEFKLRTPWVARSINSRTEAASPEVGRQPRGATEVRGRGGSRIAPTQQGQQLVWMLQPGQLNHLEAVFWFPSPIGIGAAAIALLVAGGIYVKYRLLPKSSI